MLVSKFDGATSVPKFLILCFKELISETCANQIHWRVSKTSPIALGAMCHLLAVIGGQ